MLVYFSRPDPLGKASGLRSTPSVKVLLKAVPKAKVRIRQMQEIRNSGAANFQKLALRGDEKSPSPKSKIFLKINFGSPDLTWQRYGIAETPILFNGAKTP